MMYFIDFEAFQHGAEDFQVKELCIMDATTPKRSMSYTFQPPRPWQWLTTNEKRTYEYATNHLHKLSWNEGCGNSCPSCVQKHIIQFFGASSIFYAIGRQKTEFLQRHLPKLIIIDYGECYSVTLKDLPPVPDTFRCMYREHGRVHCAAIKCYRLYLHMNANAIKNNFDTCC